MLLDWLYSVSKDSFDCRVLTSSMFLLLLRLSMSPVCLLLHGVGCDVRVEKSLEENILPR
jgi:hypothetical protein